MFKLIHYTNAFKKDYKKILKQGKNKDKIDKIISQLFSRIALDKKYKDHGLIGNYLGKRECHIEPDWILIYETTDIALVLHRTGSHSDLFD